LLAGQGWSGCLGLSQTQNDEENVQQYSGFFHTTNLCCEYNYTNRPCSAGKMAFKKLSSCIYTNVEPHKKAV
jgi:hypothetical protein